MTWGARYGRSATPPSAGLPYFRPATAVSPRDSFLAWKRPAAKSPSRGQPTAALMPAMTIGTYTHVIRELKGEPMVPAEEQIQRAREERP